MDFFVVLLLVVGVVLVTVSVLKSELKCPPPKVIYRLVPKHTLDVQFGDDNLPSEIHKDMFTESSPWIGGYQLGSGKTLVAVAKE